MYSIGVDIGGTYIKCGIIKGGKIVARDKVPTPKENNEQLIIDTIAGLIDRLLDSLSACKSCVENIGIGMAGSSEKGVCLFMPNTEWRKVRLSKLLEKRYSCKVSVVNDLKGATLGEMHYGIGKKCKDFVFVGLGTGLNIGVVKNGEYIVEGVEFGHVIVDREGSSCGCGKKGCLESVVSTKALLGYADKYCKCGPQNVKELFDMAKQDKIVEKAIYDYIEALNVGLMNICNSYRPEVIVLGGGIGEGLLPYIVDINKKLEQSKYGYPTAKKTKVVVSKVGNNCGILGVSTLK